MPVGFGFGVGDFVATVNLFKNVAVALKDHGGALDDYHKTLSKLETTSIVLSCLANIDSSTKDVAELNAVRGLAGLIQRDVDAFLAGIEKYQTKLESSDPRRFMTAAATKIKWSQFIAGKVSKLNQDVHVSTTSLGLLLNLYNIHISNTNADAQRSALALQTHASLNDQEFPAKTLRSVENGIMDVNMQFTLLNAQSVISSDRLISDMSKKHEELKVLIGSAHSQNHNLALPNDQGEAASLRFVLTIPQLNLSAKDITSLLRYFRGEIEIVFRACFASVIVCLKDLLLALPQLVLLYRMSQRLPQAISLVLHDNIAFEDALGRLQSLQFQQFQHWTVLEQSIQCSFRGLPGAQKILSGDYILRSPKYNKTLNAENWSRLVRPGIAIKMAVSFSKISTKGNRCPRGCVSEPTKLTDRDYCCRDCNLLFTLDHLAESLVQQIMPRMVNESSNGLLRDELRLGHDRGESLQIMSMKEDNEEVPQGPYDSLASEIEELKAFKSIHLTGGQDNALLVLAPLNDTFERKQIIVPFLPAVLHIGRQTDAKTVATPMNGFFDGGLVVSRRHAEIWAHTCGKVWIRDCGSSNGTFVNGQRLSPTKRESKPCQLLQHDYLGLGVDMLSEDRKTFVHRKVAARVEYVGLLRSVSTRHAKIEYRPSWPWESEMHSAFDMVGAARDELFRCCHSGCNAAFRTLYLLRDRDAAKRASKISTSNEHFCSVEGCPHGPDGNGFKDEYELIRHNKGIRG